MRSQCSGFRSGCMGVSGDGTGTRLTLSVQEVVDQDVVATLGLDGAILVARGRTVTHILLTKGLDMSVDVGCVL